MIITIWILYVTLSVVFLSFLYFLVDYVRFRIIVDVIPGPKTLPILGNLTDLLCDPVEMFNKMRRWSLQYHPVYMIYAGPYTAVNICGPDDFEIISTSTKNIQKGKIYMFLHRWLGEGLLTSTGSLWQSRRKILTPAFHFNILQQFVGVFSREAEKLIEVLKKDNTEDVDVVPIISQYTLYTINETSMGIKLEINNKEDKNYITAIHDIGKMVVYRSMRPWLYFQSVYYYLTVYGFREMKLCNILHNFTNKVIAKRSETFEMFKVDENDEVFNYSKGKKLAMLDLLLNAKIGRGVIDDRGIRDEVNTFMFEGHDTTAMSICFTLMLLACHQDIQKKVYEEINEIFGCKKASTANYNALQDLKYTEKCIKESLRLYPSVHFISRIIDEEMVTSQGYVLPVGTGVNIHIFDIHRHPGSWPNPEKFDPERFSPENSQGRHPFAYVPFSAGPRNCIGQRFAILEIKVVLCEILKNFILEPIDTPESIKIDTDIILRTTNGIRIKFLARPAKN